MATATLSLPQGFKNIGHFIASTAKNFVPAVHKLDNLLKAANKDVQLYQPEVDALLRVVAPQFEIVNDAACAALGVLGQAMDDITGAVDGNALNAALNDQAKADILKALQLLKQFPMIAQQQQAKLTAPVQPIQTTITPTNR